MLSPRPRRPGQWVDCLPSETREKPQHPPTPKDQTAKPEGRAETERRNHVTRRRLHLLNAPYIPTVPLYLLLLRTRSSPRDPPTVSPSTYAALYHNPPVCALTAPPRSLTFPPPSHSAVMD